MTDPDDAYELERQRYVDGERSRYVPPGLIAIHANICQCGAYEWQHHRGMGKCPQKQLTNQIGS